MRSSKFGFVNKESCKNNNLYGYLPCCYFDKDRVNFINVDVGMKILYKAEKVYGRCFGCCKFVEEIKELNSVFQEITDWNKYRLDVSADRMLKFPYTVVNPSTEWIKPLQSDYKYKPMIAMSKIKLEKLANAVKREVWKRIKITD